MKCPGEEQNQKAQAQGRGQFLQVFTFQATGLLAPDYLTLMMVVGQRGEKRTILSELKLVRGKSYHHTTVHDATFPK